MLRIVFLTLSLCLVPLSYAENSVRIVSSIRPLALIAQDIGGELVDVQVLLPPSASPHHYSLKISDKRMIQSADLVLWVGPEMEFFIRPLMQSKHHLPMVTEENHEVEKGHGHHEHDDEALHQWLNTEDVGRYARQLAALLIELRPMAKDTIEKNLLNFNDGLQKASLRGEKILSPVKNVGFISYHLGFDSFVEANQLNQMGVIVDVPNEKVGTKSLFKLKQIAGEVNCIMAEMGEAPQAQRYADILGLPLITADALATTHDIQHYDQFYLKLVEGFFDCLTLKKGA